MWTITNFDRLYTKLWTWERLELIPEEPVLRSAQDLRIKNEKGPPGPQTKTTPRECDYLPSRSLALQYYRRRRA